MTHAGTEVAVVGGGPAGALTAGLLAGLGHEVLLLERAPRWRWRACGVFASPASMTALRRLGVPEEVLARAAQPVGGMRVESRGGASFRLTYDGTGSPWDSAVGFDRESLDTALLDRARAAGADVRSGVDVERVAFDERQPRLSLSGAADGGPRHEARAAIVVGADGLRSGIARAVEAARQPPFSARTALTFHVAVPASDPGGPEVPPEVPRDARMVVLRDGYVGLAPVPGGRLNVGIVLGGRWTQRLRRDGGPKVAREVLASAGLASAEGDAPEPLDHVAGVRPVSAAARPRAGDRWLLVGDAAGFLDPFTGEGLHRAFVSAELAALTIHDALRGRGRSHLAAYDRAMRSRFATKDVVSRLVQAFVGQPALFEYVARRLEGRRPIRDTMGRVIGDLEPASRALDPRFLAALLAP